MITLETPLSELTGIQSRFVTYLKRLGIKTVGDILWHFPARYEDFSEVSPIGELQVGQHATVHGVVKSIDVKYTWRRHMAVAEAHIGDATGEVRAVWFNQPFVKNVLTPGKTVSIAGKVSTGERGLYFNHPTYEMMGSGVDQETKHTGRLVPVYPETRGLTSKGMRYLIHPLLTAIPRMEEWIPGEVLRETHLPEINSALHTIHFPESETDALRARRRFAFEDLFIVQLYNLRQKRTMAWTKAPALSVDIEVLRPIIAALPFTLTPSQKKSLWEVLKDMERPHPMNRLLQGDVGSGKTVVAALAALVATMNGYQAAFMAPTEVLARQHFETLRKLFKGLFLAKEPSLALLASGGAHLWYGEGLGREATKKGAQMKIKKGELQIVVGTHALIQKSVVFKNLGLVIVDEQHRFGVRQRARLSTRTDADSDTARVGQRESASSPLKSVFVPHFLSMSATPIPRTIMMTIFGDLDVSTITELPSGRKKIITKVVVPENRAKAYAFIREQVKRGRQAFVICPRIDPTSADQRGHGSAWEFAPNSRYSAFSRREAALWEVKSVREEYKKLTTNVFPDLRVAMLHGRLKGNEKTEIMRRFKEGKVDILVSTSVIEVGVDVPNASIMMIEGSERFGLAQLYQFRGRVGRGEHQSFCFLFTESHGRTVAARLKALVEAKSGFELAEYDLKLRGPGEFIGARQTGLPDNVMRGLSDMELIKMSRSAARTVIENDPLLGNHPALKEKLRRFEAKLHLE